MKTNYEYIVVGCGGIGSGAVYWLARKAGKEVLGLEQFSLGHDNGGSQDHSRIIRLSYHAPAYTALTPYTYSTWAEVEAESGVQLVVKTGGLDIGPSDPDAQERILNYAEAMRAAGIPFEQLTAKEIMERFPQWQLDDDMLGLYQADSGLVDARKANATHIALARGHGATVLDNTRVLELKPIADGVELLTNQGRFVCRRLVIAAGAWTNKLLAHVGMRLPITVTQEQVSYFATPHLREFAPDHFPIWIWHGAERDCFYGFPVYGEVATKAGEDVGGREVTAEGRNFARDERAHQELISFLQRRCPRSLGPTLYTKTCLYDLTPDRDFIIDTLPEYEQIALVQGAAHGFKFASLLGKIMSEIASEGETHYPIASFNIDRTALTDPSFANAFHV
jgi:sarcosine oxidase